MGVNRNAYKNGAWLRSPWQARHHYDDIGVSAAKTASSGGASA